VAIVPECKAGVSAFKMSGFTTVTLNTSVLMLMHCCCCTAGLSGPLFLKAAVDTLSAGGAAVLLPAVRCVLCFGLCGVIQHLTKELTYPTFTPISQV
jgi:hypothetical protein